MSDLAIRNIGQLVTNDPDRDGLVGAIERAAVAVRNGIVAWVGSDVDFPHAFASLPSMDVEGRGVVPGFVDAHSHAVYAGDRSAEHAMRLAGASYEEIQAAGGGIYATVSATRASSLHELVMASHDRIERMLRTGTTTLEVKTGYGLDLATERKMVDAIDAIDASLALDIVPTLLAHVVDRDYADDRDAYVEEFTGSILPVLADRVDFVDVFCDSIAFSVEETERIIDVARSLGLAVRLHVDQLSRTGGTRLAASVGAVAADHLDHATEDDLDALAAAGTVAVLVPGVSLMMREPFPDARKFLDRGIPVAVATDCNPGTSPIETMPFVVAMAANLCHMSVEQAVWSATAGGAMALGLDDRGVIAEGKLGDLVILDAPSYHHLAYRPDGALVQRIIKRGQPV